VESLDRPAGQIRRYPETKIDSLFTNIS